EAKMTAEQREAEVEPLLHYATLFGTHDGGRAEPKRHPLRGELLGECLHARDGRRGMAEEDVEDDGRCAGSGGGAGVIQREDGCDEVERQVQIPRLASLARDDGVGAPLARDD